MMTQIIRGFIRNIQSTRELTVAELAFMLGYKSATSLARIIQGKANMESLHKLVDKLRSCKALGLTEQESRMLDDILEQEHMPNGTDYQAMVQLRQMMRGEEEKCDPIILTVTPSGQQVTLAQRYGKVRQANMCVVNTERIPLIAELSPILENCSIRVEHYVCLSSDPLHVVRAIRSMLPGMSRKNYNGYTYSMDDRNVNGAIGMMRTDMMTCDYETEDGEYRHDIVFFSGYRGMLIETQHQATEVLMIMPMKHLFKPICVDAVDTMKEDYLAYSKFCQQLETNRAIYRIKGDVAMEQLPIPVLRTAILEGPLGKDQIITKLLPECESIFHKRHRQMRTNPQEQYHAMKQDAMWEFVRTGRMSDHFWACRTFTLAERATIIRAILRLPESCPSYHLHFLKTDDDLRSDEFILYEGEGLSIIRQGADYHLDGTHGEIMLRQEEMLKLFKRFYLDSLIRHHVRSEAESIRILKDMLNWCLSEVKKSDRPNEKSDEQA